LFFENNKISLNLAESGISWRKVVRRVIRLVGVDM
jgi:hypothetical protein